MKLIYYSGLGLGGFVLTLQRNARRVELVMAEMEDFGDKIKGNACGGSLPLREGGKVGGST